MEKVIFGIIGCGNVTEKKSGPAFRKLPHTELKWVMRRDGEKVRDYAERHGVEHFSTDYRRILADPEVDAIYISTPPHMHKFYTLEAAKHKKHVYVEKPMALTVDECREMIEACRKDGVKLFTAYYRREQEKFLKIKDIMENGELGEIRSFSYTYTSPVPELKNRSTWHYDKEFSGGGKLYDIGSHMIDLMLFLFGEVDEAMGISANQSKALEVEDVTSGILTFKSGVQGTAQMSFNGACREDLMTVTGNKGTLKFSVMNNEALVVLKDGEEVKMEFADLEHVQLPLISKVAKVILEQEELESQGYYGLRTQEILETFRDSGRIKYE